MAFENFKGLKFTALTASVLTKKKETYRKIPSILREGKKAKKNGGFFDYNLILSASDQSIGSSLYNDNAVHIEENEVTGEVGVYISSSLFRIMMDDFLSGSLPSSSYASISQSFFDQIATGVDAMPFDEAYAGILTDVFEQGSTGSGTEIAKPVTASMEFINPGIVTSSTGKGTWTIINNSTNCLSSQFVFGGVASNRVVGLQASASQKLVALGLSHLTRSFLPTTNMYVQSTYIPVWSLEVTPHHSNYSVNTLTASFSSSADYGYEAGETVLANQSSQIAVNGIEELAPYTHYYNKINANDGVFYLQSMKATMVGEFSGSQTVDSAQSANIIYFPSNSVVRSGSFKYVPEVSGAAHSTASSDVRTIYYTSGSGGPSGSYNPSSNFGKENHSVSGSHIFSDATLQTPASTGFYYANETIIGYKKVYGCFSGYVGSLTGHAVTASYFNTSSNDANSSGVVYNFTRFCSSSIHN